MANRLIRRVLYLPLDSSSVDAGLPLRCEYCTKKQIYFAIENPSSTLVWRYRPMQAGERLKSPLHLTSKSAFDLTSQKFLEKHNAISLSICLGQYGALTEKLGFHSSVASLPIGSG